MTLPAFLLRQEAGLVRDPGVFEGESSHRTVEAAVDRAYLIPEGRIILTVWRGRLHGVVYQTPLETEEESQKRNDVLFHHYGGTHEWREVLDNGFGKSFWRSDQDVFATWSYAMDVTSFLTRDLHEAE